MKQIIIIILACLPVAASFSQKQTAEFIMYTPPKDWIKEVKENTYTSFTITDRQKKTYCQLFIMLSVKSKGSIQEDFEQEWKSLIITPYKVSGKPTVTEATKSGDWTSKSGVAPFTFNNGTSTALLTTMSGYGKAVSIVVVTNSEDYIPGIQQFLASVEMKTPGIDNQTKKEPVSQPPAGSKFTFTTTNFDDGWTSTVQESWVHVAKGNTRVLIHYPDKNADAYNSVVLDGLKNAWNVLVAPRYSSATNFEFKPIHGWETIEFAEADMIEKATGKAVHVVLFKKNSSSGKGRYLEFITLDKKSFEQEFGVYQQSTSGWEKMEAMANYNKFAVAASDLQGKWTSNFTGAIQYVNANTGFDAGMNTHASNENFKFLSDGTYAWDLGVASGMVGNIKFQSVKSNGKFSMKGNWQINFSDIEGKPRLYNVHFSCIKGLRILWINDQAFAKAD